MNFIKIFFYVYFYKRICRVKISFIWFIKLNEHFSNYFGSQIHTIQYINTIIYDNV